MIYRWKTNHASGGVPAQVAGERLEAIRKKGSLTPKAVVEDAKRKTSPLHPCFEWRDEIAAEKFRLEQARTLIQNVEVVIERGKKEPTQTRAFVHVTKDEESQYESISKVMRNPALRKQVLDSALWELDLWRNRYRELQELATVLAAADEVLKASA